MKNKKSPLHGKWHRRVEGQIRDCIAAHPEYFAHPIHQDLVNSLSKRIVGEIIAELGSADSVEPDRLEA